MGKMMEVVAVAAIVVTIKTIMCCNNCVALSPTKRTNLSRTVSLPIACISRITILS